MILGPLELANMKPNKKESTCYISEQGNKVWLLHGNLHRENGPAVECLDGHKEFWLNGENFSEEEFIKHRQLQLLSKSKSR